MWSSTFPDFEDRDPYPFQVLPDGVHFADESTFRRRFVEDFPDSRTRSMICDGFVLLRQEASSHGLVATLWVDGSFVESKLDPGDIDLVSFIDYDFLNLLDPPIQDFVESHLSGKEATRLKYQTHTFLVPSCSPNHAYFPIFEQLRAYWRKWFGQTREESMPPGPRYPSIPKGLVEMSLGDPQQTHAISRERSPL